MFFSKDEHISMKVSDALQMNKPKLVFTFFSVVVIAALTRPVFGYARITIVTVQTSSSARVGEDVEVQAYIHTGNNLYEYVHAVQALLILPAEANLTSGSNPFFIGEMGPGPADAFCNWNITFENPGEYPIVVNASCIDTQHVPRWMINSTSIEVYDYPHAEFEIYPKNATYVKQAIIFNATRSHALGPNRTIVLYQWNFGDGTSLTYPGGLTPIVEHTFNKTGNFSISLNVTDNKGLSNTATVNITVTMFGDLNEDEIINILDVSIVAYSFGSRPGDPEWNPKADMDHNGLINIIDVSVVAMEYGKTA